MGQDEKAVQDHLKVCGGRVVATWLALADGVEACAVGLTARHILDTEPYLWLLHTKLCEQHPLRFIRWGKRVVDEILDLYPGVVGLCSVNNPAGKAWLEWLGARFDGSTGTSNYDGCEYAGFRISKWPLQQ